ncbi:MAG: UDP-N-acetylglucosamine--N-acetylmuramyl-(pentapeptide) pyrophosphoryl-undecaprenol [Geminicoccaceae bacterium]|nr:UDP-N-acetylglucosamine--N-acetylmuramyl-(pentapeptide) pyrophosphoryl-undecaprenol [Geminicoccaceae bacterium]
MRVFVTGGGTGGHLYPALAIARALVRLEPSLRPFFIGARRGIERDVLPATEFPHELLDLHPLYRSKPWNNWRTARGLLSAWRRIGRLSAESPPRLVIGTGGYAAGATMMYAARHGVPLFIQEQNSFPGRTVRLFSRFAREIYLGFPEGSALLPPSARRRAVYTGNPITPPPEPRPSRTAARDVWGLAHTGTVVLIFGGSQGSAALNAIIDGWVARGLPPGVQLIWATGRGNFDAHVTRESDRVRVRPYLSPIAEAYAAADMAITRAGAMTTAELVAWGIPPVLVPLPTAAADHQTVNAKALAAAGAARWVRQSDLTVDRLDVLVRELIGTTGALDAIAAAGRERARPDAADDIARRILDNVDLNQNHGRRRS